MLQADNKHRLYISICMPIVWSKCSDSGVVPWDSGEGRDNQKPVREELREKSIAFLSLLIASGFLLRTAWKVSVQA